MRVAKISSSETTGFTGCFRAGERHAIQNFPLLRLVRIIEQHLEHEAVHLRFGQRIGAFLVNRIFRGEHEERRWQLHRFAAERDLPFLHGFEQRALDFGRRAVDFVGENEVGENRPARGVVFAILRIVNQRADDVRRQQIGRELDAMKLRLHRRRERADGKRLGESGHAFEQDVAVGEQADEQPVHELFLPDDDAGDFLAQRARSTRTFARLGLSTMCSCRLNLGRAARRLKRRLGKFSRRAEYGPARSIICALLMLADTPLA